MSATKLKIPELTRIRKLREKHGISQTQLAKLSEVSQSTLCRIELGNMNTTLNTYARICKALDTAIEQKENQPPTQNEITTTTTIENDTVIP